MATPTAEDPTLPSGNNDEDTSDQAIDNVTENVEALAVSEPADDDLPVAQDADADVDVTVETNDTATAATASASAEADAAADTSSSVPDTATGGAADTAEDTAGYSADQSMHASNHHAITHHTIANHKQHSETTTETATITPVDEAATTLPKTQPVAVQGLSADEIVSRQLLSEHQHALQHENELFVAGGCESKMDPDNENAADVVFVNVGLEAWEKTRVEWLDHATFARTPGSHSAIAVNVDEIIDVIFQSPRQWRLAGGPSKFPVNVPLPQMVDILQDLWEAEGLDT